MAVLALLAGCATTGHDTVGAAVAELAACPGLAGGRVGAIVVDAADGRVLAEHASDRGFATASNMKLVSSAVALRTLGAEFRFETELWARGEVRDGVLDGDLVLVGHGDPTFATAGAASAELVAMAQAVRDAGIRRVRGQVLGDDSWQGTEHLGLGWQWDYLDEDYAAPFGALACAGNVVTVEIAPGDSGGPKVTWRGETAVPPQVAVRTVPSDEAAELVAHRALGSDQIVVGGAIASGSMPQRVVVTVRDPASHAARTFAAALRVAGVEVDGEGRAGALGDPATARRLAEHASPTLAEIVEPLLIHSNNLYAEQVWRTAARTACGDGSTAAAERHARAVLAQLGVATDGMVQADGSGLSRRNLVQPRQLAALLLAMWREPDGVVLRRGLPLAGETGTLRGRMKDGPAHGHVHAKTGYISRVVCLSGYVDRPDPQAPPLVFAAMLNDFTCEDDVAKAAIDRFAARLAAIAGWR